jgi:hypothetical protein
MAPIKFGENVEHRAGGATTQALPWKPTTLEDWIKYAPTDYLLCWVGGHKHDEQGWSGESSETLEDGSILLYQICDRCGLPMDKWIGFDGSVDGRHNVYYYYRMRKYPYPYLWHGDQSMWAPDLKDKRKLIRLELLHRGVKTYKKPKLPKEARQAGLSNDEKGVTTVTHGAISPVRFQPAGLWTLKG